MELVTRHQQIEPGHRTSEVKDCLHSFHQGAPTPPVNLVCLLGVFHA